MNQQTMTAIRKPAQAGFTLIELIVVIVILGILAATALPRFANMGGEARLAALSAARGAIESTSAMIHGQALLNPSLGTVTNEGITVTITNGYPAAAANTATAAGLNATDWDIYTTAGPADTTNHIPAVPANSFVAVPHSIKGSASAETCTVTYTGAAANGQPTVTMTATAATCQ